jgi:tRNA threonylcarbamoyladenosine biosynthesis protein TsaB
VNILAFDAAAGACSAALMHDGRMVARDFREMARGHAEALVPMIEGVMRGMPYAALTAIGVTVGPGAFTGLRIALATARGLSLATGVPALGVTSFAVAAHQARDGCPGDAAILVIALETRRADFYLQAFASSGDALTAPASVAVAELDRWLPPERLAVAGDAADRLIASLPAGYSAAPVGGAERADAATVAVLVEARLARGGSAGPPQALRPLYLRPPDVTLPKPGSRGRV